MAAEPGPKEGGNRLTAAPLSDCAAHPTGPGVNGTGHVASVLFVLNILHHKSANARCLLCSERRCSRPATSAAKAISIR